jgi:hypothetical protein
MHSKGKTVAERYGWSSEERKKPAGVSRQAVISIADQAIRSARAGAHANRPGHWILDLLRLGLGRMRLSIVLSCSGV